MVNTSPGNLSASLLQKVAGVRLRIGAAQAFGRVKAHFGGAFIALPAGGYRSASVQNAMRKAGLYGPASARKRWNLDEHSIVTIAAHPLGTHEDGYSADIWGFALTSENLAWMADNGWARPFGNSDPHHFHYSQANDHHRPVATPVKGATYKIVAGDTLSSIAAKHGTTWQKLAKLNKIKDPDTISVGNTLKLK